MAVRLKVLPHRRQPMRKVGWCPNGEFWLTVDQ
jgi:hypothetical protein